MCFSLCNSGLLSLPWWENIFFFLAYGCKTKWETSILDILLQQLGVRLLDGIWGQQHRRQRQLCMGFPGVGSYLLGGGWPGLPVVVQRSEGFSLPTPLKQTAVCLQSGRCWTLHREAESRRDISRLHKLQAYKSISMFSRLYVQNCQRKCRQSVAQFSAPRPSLPPRSSPRASPRSRWRWTPAPLRALCSSVAPPGPLHQTKHRVVREGIISTQPRRRWTEADRSSLFGPCSLIWK